MCSSSTCIWGSLTKKIQRATIRPGCKNKISRLLDVITSPGRNIPRPGVFLTATPALIGMCCRFDVKLSLSMRGLKEKLNNAFSRTRNLVGLLGYLSREIVMARSRTCLD